MAINSREVEPATHKTGGPSTEMDVAAPLILEGASFPDQDGFKRKTVLLMQALTPILMASPIR